MQAALCVGCPPALIEPDKTVSAALSVTVTPPGWEKLKSGKLLLPIEVTQNGGRRGFRTEDS